MRKMEMRGFVLSGNKLLRNIIVTVEREYTYMERVINHLDLMHSKERNSERKTEIGIVNQILTDTYEDKQGRDQEGDHRLAEALKAFREVLKWQQYLPERTVVEKGLALAEFAIENIIGGESKFIREIRVELDSLE